MTEGCILVDMDKAESGEEKLMLAVVENTIHDYVYSKPPKPGRTAYRYHVLKYQKLMRDSINYLFTNDDVWYMDKHGERKVNWFSFPFVCQWFGIPVEKAREFIVNKRKEVNGKQARGNENER